MRRGHNASSFLNGMTLSLNFIGRLGLEARPSLVGKARQYWRAEGSHHVRREKATGECRSARWPPPNRPRAIARQSSGGGHPQGSPENASEARTSRRNRCCACGEALAFPSIGFVRVDRQRACELRLKTIVESLFFRDFQA